MKKIRNFFGNMFIREKLTVSMLGLVCLFTGITTVYYYTVSTSMIHLKAERQIVNTLNQAVNNLDSNIDAAESILYDTSTSVYLQELLRSAQAEEGYEDYYIWKIKEEIRNFLMVQGTKLSAIQGFYVFDRKGEVYDVKNLRYDFHTDAIEWNRIHEAKGRSVWGTPQKGEVAFGETQAPFVIPVGKAVYSFSTQKLLGYIVMFLDVDYLQGAMSFS